MRKTALCVCGLACNGYFLNCVFHEWKDLSWKEVLDFARRHVTLLMEFVHNLVAVVAQWKRDSG